METDTAHPAATTIFDYLSRTDLPLLGRGMTSAVYELDDQRALKIYFGDPDRAYLEKLQQFYRWLAQYGLPFATPRIDAIHRYRGVWYQIEQRLHGRELAQVLPVLNGPHRERALREFAMALPALHTVAMPREPFGELLQEDAWEPVRTETWRLYLLRRTQWMLKHFGQTLRQDVPALDRLVDHFYARVDQLPPVAPRLVHGDYFLGNVLADEEGALTAVVDFSPLTLVGDPAMDLAGALHFSEVYEFYSRADREIVREAVANYYDEDSVERTELYLLFYCFRFSNCKQDDPATYQWAVGHLNRYAAEQGLV